MLNSFNSPVSQKMIINDEELDSSHTLNNKTEKYGIEDSPIADYKEQSNLLSPIRNEDEIIHTANDIPNHSINLENMTILKNMNDTKPKEFNFHEASRKAQSSIDIITNGKLIQRDRSSSNNRSPMRTSNMTSTSIVALNGKGFTSKIASESEMKFVFDHLIFLYPDRKFSISLIFTSYENNQRSTVDSSAEAFHKACDGKGPTLTLVKDTKGFIFGGFTNVEWGSTVKFEPDDDGFLFSLNKKKIILRDGGINRFSMNSLNKFGPTFGNGHDLNISNNCTQNRNSYNDLKTSYGVKDHEVSKYYLNGGKKYFQVDKYEVFSLEFS